MHTKMEAQFMKFYILIFVLSFLVEEHTVKCSTTPPEVWLALYRDPSSNFEGTPAPKEFRTKPQHKNKFASRNGSEYVTHNVTSVAFICEAPYPIEWAIPKIKHWKNWHGCDVSDGSERISNFSEALQQPENKMFQTFLKIWFFRNVDRSFTSRFICKASAPSRNNQLAQTNISLYMAGSTELENEGSTLSISHYSPSGKDGGPIVLPCRPGEPNAKVLLEKKEKSEWKNISSNYYFYNPQTGFTYPVQKLPTDASISGVYRCRIIGTTSPKKMLTINVTSSKVPPAPFIIPQYHSILNGSAKIIDGDKIKCCTGKSSVRPGIFRDNCVGHLQCELTKQITLANYNPKLKKSSANYYADKEDSSCVSLDRIKKPLVMECQGKDIDYLGLFANTFYPEAGNISWRFSEWKKRSSKISLTKYTDLGNKKTLDVKEKMLIIVGHKHQPKLGKSEQAGDSLTISEQPAEFDTNGQGDYLPGTSYFHFTELETWRKEEDIVEYGRNSYYEGEPLKIICFGLRNIHSFGAQLRLNWKNGTKSLLEKDEIPVMRRVHFYGNVTGMKDHTFNDEYNYYVAFFAKEIKADLQMDSVDCFMPVERSSDWDKLKYPITVLPK